MHKKPLITHSDKIYVAGHTGMAGSAILRALKEKGYGDPKNNGEILTTTRHEVNLLEKEKVELWFNENRPNVVILAAARVGGIEANSRFPASFLLENLKIQSNVIESAWKNKCRRFLFLGSSCIYPKLAEQPIQEESLLTGSLEETNEWYAIAKIAGIQLCRALRAQHGFDAISLMPTNLYGPGDNYHPSNSHVMAALLRRFYLAEKNNTSEVTCWGSGLPKREFLHVDDLATAAIHCLEYWDPSHPDAPRHKSNGKSLEWLNVGCGYDISIKELAEKVANLCKYQGKINWDLSKPDGTPRKLLDVSNLKNLGWEPQYDIEKGLIKVLKEFPNALETTR